MKDLNCDPEPLVADLAVAKAWGQERFAHFSTVCAAFDKLTTENVRQLTTPWLRCMLLYCSKRLRGWPGPTAPDW